VVWVLWLALPIAATAFAALWAWWRARPAHVPSTDEAMRAHRDYLNALVIPARGAKRPEPSD
jgi:hypothetical protein